MSLAKIVANIATIYSCEIITSRQTSISSCIILNKISLLPLLIVSSEAINNVVIFMKVIVLCSSTRVNPSTKFMIVFAKYI